MNILEDVLANNKKFNTILEDVGQCQKMLANVRQCSKTVRQCQTRGNNT